MLAMLWQFAAAILLAAPASAATRSGSPTSAPTAHCHAMVATSQAATTTDGGSSSPDCCTGVSACHCACTQGSNADKQAAVLIPASSERPVEPALGTPPFLRQTAEVFRPPI